MTRLIFIRHGQSRFNELKIICGQSDCVLTELGHRQAEYARDFLAENESLDAIYSSDLQRTRQTAAPTAAHFGLPVRLERGIREKHIGLWGGRSLEEIKAMFPENYEDITSYKVGAAYPEGESLAEIESRIYNTLMRIVRENEGKTVALFAHGGAIATMYKITLGDEQFEKMRTKFGIFNATLHIFALDNGKFTFEKSVIPFPNDMIT